MAPARFPRSFGNGFAGGGAGISLRGLGAASTLVLLNGRRMAPYGLADDGQKVFTDLSIIPLEAVERMEVLKDGASAIYGSDAIAGVVNIILRRDFTRRGRQGFGTALPATATAMRARARSPPASATWPRTASTSSSASNVSKTDEIMISDRRNRKWIGTGDMRASGATTSPAALPAPAASPPA